MNRAQQIGQAAIRWRRLDVAALALEERIPLPGNGPVDERAVAHWRKANRAAADAHDEFMSLLADSIAEQEILGT
jgi:hypothetical protein